MTFENFLKIDFDHIWHPFTQATVWSANEQLIIDSASGVELIDIKGNSYLDGVSSLWANVHGHSVPELISALKNQADKLCHSTLLGLTHTQIIELTRNLLNFLPHNLSRIFYADSGSAAVEAALRMSLEWWQNQNEISAKKRIHFASLYGAYHGDTLGAVNVGFLEPFHTRLRPIVKEAFRVYPPHYYILEKGFSLEDALEKSLLELHALFKARAESLAAFIIEPLCQGAAGIWTHPLEYLLEVSKLCKKNSVLLIADEVATGFGKTGKMFATDYILEHTLKPDFITMGKGLSAGYLPISAVATSEEVFQGFNGKLSEYKTFYFGQTFAGNPLAAALAVENLKLFSKNNFFEELNLRITYFQNLLQEKIRPLKNVFEVRSIGIMTAIELTKIPGKFAPYQPDERIGHKIVLESRKLGVVIRPLGNAIVLMPPLAIDTINIHKLVSVTAQAILTACES